jgi:hypothetical protein
MKSSSFTLNKSDRLKSVAIAVIAAVLAALQQALAAHSFDFVAYDWAGILDLSLKVAGAYLVKDLFSTKDGKVFGKIG